MNIVSVILTVLVALEFFYIMYLETFATTSASTSRVFKISKESYKMLMSTYYLRIKVCIMV